MNDYVVITRLTPWGKNYDGTNALVERRHAGSRSKYAKLQNDLCNEWNRTHEQKAWISGCVYLEWPGRHLDEKLYDISKLAEELKANGDAHDSLIAGVLQNIVKPNDLGIAVAFDKVKGRREYLAAHPEL